MGSIIALAAGDPASQQLLDGVQSRVTAEIPLIIGGIVGIALAAFGIKMLWVAWRAGSKAVGKAGS